MIGGDVTVGYEIADDPGMREIVRRGEAVAEQAFAYSVHLDVRGLQPGRPYWYRFLSGDAASRVGRASTLPAPGAGLERLRFGFVSCSNYEHGYFSAYRHLADENPEIVLYLGDYIYEHIEERRPVVRRHSDGIEAATLPTYRNRHAQYRLDPDLQRLHAEVPALITWDDHDVQNDYADKWSQYFDDPELFLLRRAAAYQAFYEHMPLRPIVSRPEGPRMRIYDRFSFGDLIEISMIDGRQYRSREPCYAPPDKGGMHLEIQCRLSGAPRGRSHHARLCPGGLAPQQPRAQQGAMEFDRAGRADGAVPGQAGRCGRVLDRQLGRISSEPHAPAQAHPADAGVQSRGRRRRHPFVLRQRPQARFRPTRLPRSSPPNSSVPRSRPMGRRTR